MHYRGRYCAVLILDGTITGTDIEDGSVTAADIADGAASGLDADLLDGLNSTSFDQRTLSGDLNRRGRRLAVRL